MRVATYARVSSESQEARAPSVPSWKRCARSSPSSGMRSPTNTRPTATQDLAWTGRDSTR
jgi:hypothetical protein